MDLKPMGCLNGHRADYDDVIVADESRGVGSKPY